MATKTKTETEKQVNTHYKRLFPTNRNYLPTNGLWRTVVLELSTKQIGPASIAAVESFDVEKADNHTLSLIAILIDAAFQDKVVHADTNLGCLLVKLLKEKKMFSKTILHELVLMCAFPTTASILAN